MSCKKVIISACLLGEYCRYDGKTKKVNEVVEAFKDWEIIPFCPEAPETVKELDLHSSEKSRFRDYF